MPKVILTPLSNLQNEQTAVATINQNMVRIAEAVEKTLFRDGTAPNEMNSDLDMNNHRIYNLPKPVGVTEPLRKADADEILSLVDEFQEVIDATEGVIDAYEGIQTIYLGEKTSFPAVDNQGNPLQEGALVFITGQPDPEDDGMYVYHNGGWALVGTLPAAFESIETLYVAGGETVIATVNGYTPGSVKVFRNGVLQKIGANIGSAPTQDDVAAFDGTNLIFPSGALVGDDLVTVISSKPYSVVDLTASDVAFTPTVDVTSNTVQGAIVEVEGHIPDKASNSETVIGTDTNKFTTPSGVSAAITAAVAASGAAIPGEIKLWSGVSKPALYDWADGRTVSRSTYGTLFNNLTISVTGTATSSSPTVTGLATDLTGLGIEGASVEATGSGLNGLTVVSVTSTTITLSGNASSSGSVTIRIFPHGVGNGTTTFNLPDLRGRVPAGRDNLGGTAANRLTNSGTGNPGINAARLGASGGADRHILVTNQIPAHNHSGPDNEGLGTANLLLNGGSASASGSNRPVVSSTGTRWPTGSLASAGGDQAHPNAQPTIALNYIVYLGA